MRLIIRSKPPDIDNENGDYNSLKPLIFNDRFLIRLNETIMTIIFAIRIND